MYLKIEKEKMIVDCYGMHLYLPAEYADSAYRGSPYYSVLGTRIRFFGVGNMRFFKDEKEMSNPESVKSHPFGVPMLIMTEPTEVDVQELRLSKNGPIRKLIVMTYLKGDPFIINTETIKDFDAMMMYLTRLDQGKVDHVPPDVAVSILNDCETMNGISLRIPSEEKEIFVAEKYRDPDSPTRKYRYHTGKTDPDSMVSYNTRIDAMKSTTFQGLMHEDPSVALISAVNRHDAGIEDEPGMFEALIRGMDMTPYERRDYSTDNG